MCADKASMTESPELSDSELLALARRIPIEVLRRVASGGAAYCSLIGPGFGREPTDVQDQTSRADDDKTEPISDTRVRILAARLRVRVDKEAGKLTPKWIIELAASGAVGLGAGLSASSGPRR